MPSPPRLVAASLFAAATLALPRPAFAARPHFEPTDLELQDPGLLEVDLQLGFARSAGPWRAVLPDAEINLVQLGPKLPVAAGAYGLGYEALFLLGHTIGTTHLDRR